MTQWLRAYIALSEDSGSIPNTLMVAYNCLYFSFKGPTPPSDIHSYAHATHCKTLIYMNKFKI